MSDKKKTSKKSERDDARAADARTWSQLDAEAGLERIRALTGDEVAAEIRAAGGDPEAIGKRGAALAAKLLADRGVDWKTRAASRRAEIDARAGDAPSFTGWSRDAMEAHLTKLRADRRIASRAQPLMAAFRKRRADAEHEVSDDELRALLEEIELLARMHADDGTDADAEAEADDDGDGDSDEGKGDE